MESITDRGWGGGGRVVCACVVWRWGGEVGLGGGGVGGWGFMISTRNPCRGKQKHGVTLHG